jgi:hypothetical protein
LAAQDGKDSSNPSRMPDENRFGPPKHRFVQNNGMSLAGAGAPLTGPDGAFIS